MLRKLGRIVTGAAAAAILVPSVAVASTKTVYAGGPLAFQKTLQKSAGAGVNAFFTGNVTIHQGDTVRWVGMSLGFHTIDLPGRAAGDLPTFIADPAHPVTGSKDAAGNPLWFNGLPTPNFNPALGTPIGGRVYDGSQRVDSGAPLGPPKPFAVKFTRAGTYRYFCDIHYGMQGTVKVLPTRARVPSAASDARALAKQVAQSTASARRLDKTTVSSAAVQLGASDSHGVEVFAMFPSTLRVTAGTTVTFSMSAHTREVHTASFGDTSRNGYLAKLAASFNSPVVDPLALFPSDPPPAPIALGPTSHGNGFVSTGVLDQDKNTPNPPANRITFTTPGTYNYICLIHPFMHGTVIVS